MKVIFLDFDGVLNSSEFAAHQYQKNESAQDSMGLDLFDPKAVECMNRIIDATEAKIVVTSSWRYLGLTALRDMWHERGLHGQIIGMTSLHVVDEYIMEQGLDWLDKGAIASSPRAVEIEAWLQEHDNIDNFVILDDMPMSATLQSHFVQINPKFGLTDQQVKQAITIFNTK